MRGRRQAICRRRFLRRSLAGAGGLAAAQALGWTDLVKLHAEDLRRRGMACILLWMQGGPSQFETFDPKLGGDSGGPTKAIPTAVPGIHIAEHWPRVARGMKDIAIIRSMTNREGNHQRATYQLHTGYVPTASVKYPTFGSVVSERLGDRELDLPSHVLLGRAGNQKLGGGYLGVDHDPFVVLRSGQRPDNTEPAVGRERLGRRLGLLERLEGDFEASGGGRLVTDHRSLYRRASRLSLSPRLSAFDLDAEPRSTREAYGDSEFGRGCLLARRLVESGVTFVEVRSGGWDTHQDNFNRVGRLAAQVDPGFAQLVRDLRLRGMLSRTLVIWMGEFGRTPRINPRTGRDHFPRAFNVALAGAGVQGGRVIGKTSDDGLEVADRPVTVPDLFCTIARALRIDPRHEYRSGLGRPVKIVEEGEPVSELFS